MYFYHHSWALSLIYIYVHTHTYIHNTHVRMHTHIYVCMYACMCTQFCSHSLQGFTTIPLCPTETERGEGTVRYMSHVCPMCISSHPAHCYLPLCYPSCSLTLYPQSGFLCHNETFGKPSPSPHILLSQSGPVRLSSLAPGWPDGSQPRANLPS